MDLTILFIIGGIVMFSVGVSRYWGKPIDKHVTQPQLLKLTCKWVFNVWNNGKMLGGNYFHRASLVDFRLAPRRKIRLWYLNFRSIPRLYISHIETKSQLWSLHRIKSTEAQHWTANWHAMNGHFLCPVITVWGVTWWQRSWRLIQGNQK